MNKKLLLLVPILFLTLGCNTNNNNSNTKDHGFTVTWTDYDGTVLETDRNVEKGTMPEYNSALPNREADAQYSYEFKSWSPALTPVESDVTYMATYTGTVREYTVRWTNYDGTLLKEETNVPYGTIPSYELGTPEKPSTVDKSYFFDGWEPEIGRITGDITYIATYREATRYYLITWKNWDGMTLKISSVAYGAMPTYDGSVRPTHVADESYTYEFSGWSPEIVICGGDATYTAQFTAIPIE